MEPTIKIEDIAHVRFAVPDFAVMQEFLQDFGLSCLEQNGRLYGRAGDGRAFVYSAEQGEPAFIALGLRAESLKDLETLARKEGASIEPLDDVGGGQVVRLTDPDGFRVEVVAGQDVQARAAPGDAAHNSAAARRRKRETLRLTQGPSHVHRIGHCVLNVSDFRTSEAWYKERFGFLTSDEIELAPDTALGAFMRCDRGDQLTDHHTLFLAQLPQPPGFMHAAFEVAHLDDLMLGHAHLKARKRDQAWGIGRHIMGSQIFDYWRDPFGHELEHWTDGDLFTSADPPGKMPFTSLLAVQWGAPHPMMAAQASSD